MDLMDKNAQFEHKSEKLTKNHRTKNDKLEAESKGKDKLILEKILQFY